MTDDIDRSSDWYNAALAGNRGPIDPNNPKTGFYRVRNGRGGPFVPVAFWYDSQTQELRCHKSGRSLDDLAARELWVYAAKNLVPEHAYWSFIDGHGWPDNDTSAAATAKGPEIDPETDPAGSLKAEIAAARAGLDAYKTIESDEAAARAQTLRSALTGLSGKATKAYEALNRPLLDKQKEIREVWFPIRDDAANGADAIRKALGAWEDTKREAARKAQAETDRKAAEHAAAVRKAEEANQPPPPPPPPPVAPNMPAPSAQIRGGSGRTASVTVANIVTDIDLDKCFAKFRTSPELRELFMDLANKSMKAGIHTAADLGAVIEQKSVIR